MSALTAKERAYLLESADHCEQYAYSIHESDRESEPEMGALFNSLTRSAKRVRAIVAKHRKMATP